MFQLQALLTPELTLCRAPGVSKKRLFETAATFIAEQHPELQDSEITTMNSAGLFAHQPVTDTTLSITARTRGGQGSGRAAIN